MRLYEMVAALRPGLGEDALTATREAIEGSIRDRSGSIEDAVDLGARRFAYEVEGESQGHFIRIFFHSEPANVDDISNDVEAHEDVIRLTVTRQIMPLPEHEEERSEEDVSTE